jgi:hypothetical protein
MARRKTHSDKALETLKLMGTEPGDWSLTEIKWVTEEREIKGLVKCPDCRGEKLVRLDDDGNVIPMPNLRDGYSAWQDYMRLARAEHRARNRERYAGCPRCAKRQRGWMVSQGKVPGLVTEKVKVGYPQWPEGTVFDSRFRCGCACQLCDKTILKSWRVPVNTTAVDGTVHGMWVGSTCAGKFLDVKIKREKTSIMEGE